MLPHVWSQGVKNTRDLSRLTHDHMHWLRRCPIFLNLEFPTSRSLNLRIYRERRPRSRGCVHVVKRDRPSMNAVLSSTTSMWLARSCKTCCFGNRTLEIWRHQQWNSPIYHSCCCCCCGLIIATVSPTSQYRRCSFRSVATKETVSCPTATTSAPDAFLFLMTSSGSFM